MGTCTHGTHEVGGGWQGLVDIALLQVELHRIIAESERGKERGEGD